MLLRAPFCSIRPGLGNSVAGGGKECQPMRTRDQDKRVRDIAYEICDLECMP